VNAPCHYIDFMQEFGRMWNKGWKFFETVTKPADLALAGRVLQIS
jgi:hypothetical protein